ncbi:MAG: hypothetical protein JRI68_02275 [Deltaproteobacteria bacterium]|nr:hypothetical protein [Deltaproteobacteria bacterium]
MPRSLSDLFERGKPVGAWSLVGPLDKNLAAPLWVAHAGGRVAYVRSFRVRSLRTAERLKQVVGWAVAYEHNSLLPHLDLLELEGGGGYAVVSHYEEGHLFASMLAKANLARKPVPPAVAAQIALDLLDALVATGGRLAPAWAHGGLRPESVLITRGGRARLMELGAAGVMAAVDPLARDVRWAAYASPEQTETGKPGPNSDVFSLAALLWEMLVNRPAFEGRGYADVKPKLLDAEVDRADRRARERVPRALADVIAQGLAREPDERFETPKAFAAAIVAASESVAHRVEVADYLERLHQTALNVRRRNLEQALGRPAPTSIPPAPREGPRLAASTAPKAPKVPQLDGPPPSSVRPPPSSRRPPASGRPTTTARPTRPRPAIAPPPKSAPRPDFARPPRSAPAPESAPPPRANVLPPDPVPLTRRADSSPSADPPPPAAAGDSELDWDGEDAEAAAPEASTTEADEPAEPETSPSEADEPAEPETSPSEDDEEVSSSDRPLDEDDGIGGPPSAPNAPTEKEPVQVDEDDEDDEDDGDEPAPAAAPSVEVALDLDDDEPSAASRPGGDDPAAASEPEGEEEPDVAPAEASEPTAAADRSSAPAAAAPAFDPEALLADDALDDIIMRPPRRWPALVAGMVIGAAITLALVYGTGGPGADRCADAGAPDGSPAVAATPAPTPPAASTEPNPSATASATASASASAKPEKSKPKAKRPRPRPKPAPTKPTAAPPPPPPPPTEGTDIYD